MAARRIFFIPVKFLSSNKPCKNRVNIKNGDPPFCFFLDKKIPCVVPFSFFHFTCRGQWGVWKHGELRSTAIDVT